MFRTHRLITNVLSEPLYGVIKSYIDESVGTLYFIMPFITNSVIESLLSEYHGEKVVIITSWRADYLQRGVSSIELYPLSKEQGWFLFINSHLHAKIISDSLNSCIITSANCTKTALIEEKGNIESIIYVDRMGLENRIEIERLLYSSIPVDDDLYEKYVSLNYSIDSTVLDCEMVGLIDYYDVNCLPKTGNPEVLWYYVSSELDYDETIEHDLAVFTSRVDSFSDKDCFIDDLQNSFISHPFIQLIESQITNDGTRFGFFKRFIRDHCSNGIKPSYGDLNIIVQNLYAWFIYLFPDKYHIKQPHVSQLLTRI